MSWFWKRSFNEVKVSVQQYRNTTLTSHFRYYQEKVKKTI